MRVDTTILGLDARRCVAALRVRVRGEMPRMVLSVVTSTEERDCAALGKIYTVPYPRTCCALLSASG